MRSVFDPALDKLGDKFNLLIDNKGRTRRRHFIATDEERKLKEQLDAAALERDQYKGLSETMSAIANEKNWQIAEWRAERERMNLLRAEAVQELDDTRKRCEELATRVASLEQVILRLCDNLIRKDTEIRGLKHLLGGGSMKSPIEALLDSIEWTAYEKKHEIDDGIPFATHYGTLAFYGISLKVYQLSDGQRVIDADDVRAMFSDNSTVRDFEAIDPDVQAEIDRVLSEEEP